ncbi:hypothetical protein [Streptomyces sp. NBC_01497]|uniref:hypothetical protein n=1 Tax=Streptomyces sp. NBC_01497 TaxID=2903885 RepID=UPI002E347B7B|nr:hypothetical protein [Streptomyces sp. NBC_01497]
MPPTQDRFLNSPHLCRPRGTTCSGLLRHPPLHGALCNACARQQELCPALTPRDASALSPGEGAWQPRQIPDWNGDRRVATLAVLAHNPHTSKPAVTDLLPTLHPVEIRWLITYDKAPAWLKQEAQRHVSPDPNAGVLRLLSDEELDQTADPAAILQSWIDTGNVSHMDQVAYAIIASRHCTRDLLRQLPFRIPLTSNDRAAATDEVLRACGSDTRCWHKLQKVLKEASRERTFGEVLDGADMPAPRPVLDAGRHADNEPSLPDEHV